MSRLTTPVAILIAAVILAVTFSFNGRWETKIVPSTVWRIDRWTGKVEVCQADPADVPDNKFSAVCGAN